MSAAGKPDDGGFSLVSEPAAKSAAPAAANDDGGFTLVSEPKEPYDFGKRLREGVEEGVHNVISTGQAMVGAGAEQARQIWEAPLDPGHAAPGPLYSLGTIGKGAEEIGDVAMRAMQSGFQVPAAMLRAEGQSLTDKIGPVAGFIPGGAGEILGSIPEGFIGEGGIPHIPEERTAAPREEARSVSREAAPVEGREPIPLPAEPTTEAVAGDIMAAGDVDQAIKTAQSAVTAPPLNVDAMAAEAQRQGAESAVPAEKALEPAEPIPAPALDDGGYQEVARPSGPAPLEPAYSDAKTRAETYSRWLDDLDAKRRQEAAGSPMANFLRQSEAVILGKVNGVEDRLTNAGSARLADVRGALDELLNPSGDSSDMARVREAMLAEHQKMADAAAAYPKLRASADLRQFAIPPDATAISTFRSADDIKAHPDYAAAKAGDTGAAERLVSDSVKPEQLDEAKQAFGPDVVYVPVTAQEASGHNAIPEALAHYYAESTGAAVSHDIAQANEVFHTGSDPMERISARPVFEGAVEPGKSYVLVDDVTVMGGTLAELSNHIQEGGGRVEGVVTLANASRGGVFSPKSAHVQLVEGRFGDEIRSKFGVEPRALTAEEAHYLSGFRDADELQTRAAKAAGEGKRGILQEPVRAPETNSEVIPDARAAERFAAEPHPAEIPRPATMPLRTEYTVPRLVEGGARSGEPRVDADEVPRPRALSLKPLEGTGEERERAVNSAGYNVGEEAPQKEAAEKFVAKDPEGAEAVAMRQKQPPAGVHPEFVFMALEAKATREGNTDLVARLNQSRIAEEATTMGQRIAAWRNRDPLSAVAQVEAVENARKGAVEKSSGDLVKAKAKALNDLTQEVRQAKKTAAATRPRQSWSDFIASITCAGE